jgi:hypothetical protein
MQAERERNKARELEEKLATIEHEKNGLSEELKNLEDRRREEQRDFEEATSKFGRERQQLQDRINENDTYMETARAQVRALMTAQDELRKEFNQSRLAATQLKEELERRIHELEEERVQAEEESEVAAEYAGDRNQYGFLPDNDSDEERPDSSDKQDDALVDDDGKEESDKEDDKQDDALMDDDGKEEQPQDAPQGEHQVCFPFVPVAFFTVFILLVFSARGGKSMATRARRKFVLAPSLLTCIGDLAKFGSVHDMSALTGAMVAASSRVKPATNVMRVRALRRVRNA